MARQEVARMHSEREQYEETMKKAFMRGVCALNMEAMGMFRENGNEENLDPAFKENGNSTDSETGKSKFVWFCGSKDQIRLKIRIL